MNKKNFAFDKVNFILLAASICVILLGFVLMSGGSSTREAYDPSIFDARHTKLAPAVCFLGFISLVYAVVRKPKDEKSISKDADEKEIKDVK